MPQSISDINGDTAQRAAFLRRLSAEAREALNALGQLLTGMDNTGEEDVEGFRVRCLGVERGGALSSVTDRQHGVGALCMGLAVAELVDSANEIGPGKRGQRPDWVRTEIGSDTVETPVNLSLHLPAGTADPLSDIVIQRTESDFDDGIFVRVSANNGRGAARTALDGLIARGKELNPYRGRTLRAFYSASRMGLSVIDLPRLTRDDIVLPPMVWAELDLAVAAVTHSAPMLDRLGLGCRRGVLLVGAPGTGKSAVSAVISRDLNANHGFTVIYVEAKCGSALMGDVMRTAAEMAPAVVVLEDLDLYVRGRSDASTALSELLQGMDIHQDARVLTIASTNDTKGMDSAAIRTGRFDSILEIPHPDTAACARILDALLSAVPADRVDTAMVAARLTPGTTGADIREIVRRTVLSTDGRVDTAALLAVVRDGRYRPQLPSGDGQYL